MSMSTCSVTATVQQAFLCHPVASLFPSTEQSTFFIATEPQAFDCELTANLFASAEQQAFSSIAQYTNLGRCPSKT